MWVVVAVVVTGIVVVATTFLVAKILTATVQATSEAIVASIRPSGDPEQAEGTSETMFEADDSSTSLPWEVALDQTVNSPSLPEPYNPMDTNQ